MSPCRTLALLLMTQIRPFVGGTTSPCAASCFGELNGDYHSCGGCNVYATCSNGILYDNRPCPANLVWDSSMKRCEYNTLTCDFWGPWGAWSGCSVACGTGTHTRSRTCLGVGSAGCLGSASDSGTCNTHACPDCSSIYDNGERQSGVYWIQPASSPQAFQVRCEMMEDGGWTVLLRRYDGSLDFYRTWQSYKEGFGAPDQEHYLGNDRIHIITQAEFKLRVEFTYWSDNSNYRADYQTFQVDSEADNYRLHIGSFSGNATYNPLIIRHDNMMFSTKDRDNDIWSDVHCAQARLGGWWYSDCYCHLTGPVPPACSGATCMAWMYGGNYISLRAATMKVKPK